MVAKKSTRKQKSTKLGVKRETLRDLDVKRKAKDVKGGSIVHCATRGPQ